jgi:preprotein translocase subunit SecF
LETQQGFIFDKIYYMIQSVNYLEPPEPEFENYSLKKLLLPPLAVLLVATSILIVWFIMFGIPVDLGMVFTGGTEVRVQVDDGMEGSDQLIQDTFGEESASITTVGDNDYVISFAKGTISSEEIDNRISNNENLDLNEFSRVSASLGTNAQALALQGMILAFVLMSLFVIIMFRSLIPAVVILLSAVSNIIVGAAAMNLTGISLSMGTVGALLMLIGYSVDSDILLNTKVLKSKSNNDFDTRVHDAMRTGVTMTITSLLAMIMMMLVASLFGIDLLRDMGFVLSIGLAMDLINTYMMNVSILRWYVNKGDKI